VKALVYHIDVDPLKQQMPVFYVNAKARYRADVTTALKQLNGYISSKGGACVDSARIAELDREFKAREEQITKDEQPPKGGTLSTNHLVGSVRDAVPKDSVFIVEAVTMTAIVFDHLKLSTPGSMFNSGAGGRKVPVPLFSFPH